MKVQTTGPDAWSEHFATTLPTMSRKNQLLSCVGFGVAAINVAEDPDPGYAAASILFFALAEACFEAFSQLGAPRTTRTEGCGPMASVKVPVAVTQTSAGYAVQLKGPAANARPKFTARCAVNGGEMTLSLKAKKRRTLAKTLGPNISLGIVASTTNSGAAPLTVSFGRPR